MMYLQRMHTNRERQKFRSETFEFRASTSKTRLWLVTPFGDPEIPRVTSSQLWVSFASPDEGPRNNTGRRN
jgi:hypothetical protein